MLARGSLHSAFKVYWADLELCRSAKAYWALLHLTVCLPDICAALQSDNGRTTCRLYIAWCDQYLPDPLLSSLERYQMRCNVLHQGRATAGTHGRYAGFSFAQPASTGLVDHKRVDGDTLVLDVATLATETKVAIDSWISYLEDHPSITLAINTHRNLPSLIQLRQFPLPPPPGASPTDTTEIINRSS